MPPTAKPTAFDLKPGRKIGTQYQIERLLGSGVEGEVYQIRETETGIARAAKIYYPNGKKRTQGSVWHARKLHALRRCPIVLQYHHSERITIRRQRVRCMISELCEGLPLGLYIHRHPRKRMHPYKALHILYQLVRGLESIHLLGEYHADVHVDNIMIHPQGVRFAMKLIDFYDWGKPSREKQHQDVHDAVRVLYDCLGGASHYADQPDEIRHICGGLKYTLIRKRFPHMIDLRKHLESFEWENLG